MSDAGSIKDIVMGFYSNTTCHGPAHIVKHMDHWQGYLWAFITTGLSAFLIYTIVHQNLIFFSRDVQSQTTSETAGMKGLQLPAIIICNRGFFSQAKLLEVGMDSNTASYLVGTTVNPGMVQTKNLHIPPTSQLIQAAQEQLKGILTERNFTLKQLITTISYSCEDMVLRCSYKMELYDGAECCEQWFYPVATTSGRCYTRVSNEEERQFFGGEYNGFTFYLRMPLNDVPTFSPELVDMSRVLKSDIQVTVTSNLTYPSFIVSGQGTIMTRDSLTSIQLSLTEIYKNGMKTIIDVFTDSCLKSWEVDPESHPHAYLSTFNNCQDGSMTKCFYELCDCYMYGISSGRGFTEDGEMCTLNKSVQCFAQIFQQYSNIFELETFSNMTLYPNSTQARKAKQCLKKELMVCKEVCEELKYGFISTVSPLRQAFLADLYRDLHLDRGTNSVAVVTVFFPTTFFARVKVFKQTIVDLISDVGGYMGLFLGCSLITLTEFLLVSLNILRHCLSKLRYRLCPPSNRNIVTPISLRSTVLINQ